MADALAQILARLQSQGSGQPLQIGAQYGWTPQQVQQTGLLGDAPKVPVFDGKSYLANNADVQQAWNAGNPWGRGFQTPDAWAQAHYNEVGQREGRPGPTMMGDPAAQPQAQMPPTPPVNLYQGDFRHYGQGPEHMWFGGLNGQPYGLTAFTGAQQHSIGGSQLEQLLAALTGAQGANARKLLNAFTIGNDAADGSADGDSDGNDGNGSESGSAGEGE